MFEVNTLAPEGARVVRGTWNAGRAWPLVGGKRRREKCVFVGLGGNVSLGKTNSPV